MTEVRVNNFDDLHRQFATYLGQRRWLFRGLHGVSFPLVFRFGRKEYARFPWKEMFGPWKRRAAEFVREQAQNDWDWMAIAQHHGLASKLMDWSYNPLIACYFEVFRFINQDCVVYAFFSNRDIDPDKKTPEGFYGVARFKPRGIAARIIRQRGIFTYHNPENLDPQEQLQTTERLDRIIITEEYRHRLIYELDHYGGLASC